MKAVLKLLALILTSLLLFSSCTFEHGIVLFNNQPITKENALDNSKTFRVNSKVYYLFIAPNRMKNEYIRVQVFKIPENVPIGGSEVVRTKDYRLMKGERYYHTNYFTFHEAGHYVMQVFSIDDLQHPLSFGDFYVR